MLRRLSQIQIFVRCKIFIEFHLVYKNVHLKFLGPALKMLETENFKKLEFVSNFEWIKIKNFGHLFIRRLFVVFQTY